MNKVIFSTPFTGKTPWGNGFKNQEWYDHRANIFIEYTLKSLKNQTDQSFLWWGQFRSEEKDNPTTKKIENALKESGIQWVMTFFGPIMIEDKALWHNIDLLNRSEASLKKLESLLHGVDAVLEVNLDSDDMVSSQFVELLMSKEPKERGAYYMTKGYMYSVDNRLAEWNNPYSMSIYTISYPKNVFLDPKERWKYQSTYEPTPIAFNSHEQIPMIFNAEKLPDGMYCVINHGWNISTIWGHPYTGKEIYSESEKKKVLSNFLP